MNTFSKHCQPKAAEVLIRRDPIIHGRLLSKVTRESMSGLNLNALSENASRLGMRIQETLSEHTRDLAIRGSSGIFDTPDEKAKNIRKQLDSSSDREKLDAMKRLIAVCNSHITFVN